MADELAMRLVLLYERKNATNHACPLNEKTADTQVCEPVCLKAIYKAQLQEHLDLAS